MNQQLHIRLFGSPQIRYQGQLLNGFVSAKVRALLIYLAVTARPHRRDHLAELLWAKKGFCLFSLAKSGTLPSVTAK